MRLIDADATFELLRSLGSRDYRRDKGTIMDAMKMISHPEYTPTVDAVPVVRCKDCRHWIERTANGIDTFHTCWFNGSITGRKHFCSYGERKDNERKAD